MFWWNPGWTPLLWFRAERSGKSEGSCLYCIPLRDRQGDCVLLSEPCWKWYFVSNPIFGGINIWSREKILIVRPSKCIVFTNTQTQDWLLRVLSGMRPPSPSIPEKEFLYASLKEALRLDGRSLLEQRKIEISFGGDLGYVECSIGKTRCAHKICPWYSYSKFFQSDCTSWRENGQAFTWEAIRRNHHDPFGNITYGIERVWNRTVDVYF